MADHSQLACVLSAIILADTKQEVNQESITRVLSAAGVEVKPQWPFLFGRFLQGKDILELMTSISVGGGAQAAAAGGDAPAAEEKKEEKKKEETEEEIIAGFGFDDDDD